LPQLVPGAADGGLLDPEPAQDAGASPVGDAERRQGQMLGADGICRAVEVCLFDTELERPLCLPRMRDTTPGRGCSLAVLATPVLEHELGVPIGEGKVEAQLAEDQPACT